MMNRTMDRRTLLDNLRGVFLSLESAPSATGSSLSQVDGWDRPYLEKRLDALRVLRRLSCCSTCQPNQPSSPQGPPGKGGGPLIMESLLRTMLLAFVVSVGIEILDRHSGRRS